MKLEGDKNLPGKPADIFHRLLDPEMLARCIKGCENLEALESTSDGPRLYLARVRVGIGLVKGSFKANVSLSEIEAPSGYTIAVTARSVVGSATGTARVTLASHDERTHLKWHADTRVSGIIAAVGQRVLGAAAKRFTDTFFERLAAEVE